MCLQTAEFGPSTSTPLCAGLASSMKNGAGHPPLSWAAWRAGWGVKEGKREVNTSTIQHAARVGIMCLDKARLCFLPLLESTALDNQDRL